MLNEEKKSSVKLWTLKRCTSLYSDGLSPLKTFQIVDYQIVVQWRNNYTLKLNAGLQKSYTLSDLRKLGF